MEKTNPNVAEVDESTVNLGAHDPKVDLVRNKNLFKKSLIFAGAFVVILLGVLLFQYIGKNSAQEKINQADAALANATDSASVEAAYAMYDKIAQDANYAPNMRARMVSASHKYQNGDYQGALEVLDGFRSKSIVATTGVYCLRGDCYINLDKVDEGIAEFEDALAEAEGNPELEPYVLKKLANAYRFKGDYANEAKMLERLMTEYPSNANAANVEAELTRAKAQS